MLEVVDTGINSFAPVASHVDVPPIEEPVFIITSGQLEAIILQATTPLLERLENLERGVGPGEGGEEPAIGPTSRPGGQGGHLLQDKITLLEAENRGLKAQLESLEEITARERAYDRQRLARLERVDPQPLQKDRGEILRALIAANGGKMLATDARKKMHLTKPLFSMLLASMGDDVDIKPLHSDKRKRVLTLK